MAAFVLIHGSWHGAWCWHKIVPRLQAAGHTAIAFDLPAHGRDWQSHRKVDLEANVQRVCAAIDEQTEPVVLVAHSRGGVVASQAAELRPEKISCTVYVSAYLVPNGRSVLDYFAQDGDSMVPVNLDRNLEEGWDMLRADCYREVLYADCTEDDVALCSLLLTPEPIATALTPLKLSEEKYGSVPRFYVEMLQDRAVSHRLQKQMYTESPCERVMTLDSSHSAYFSQPNELTRHLLSVL